MYERFRNLVKRKGDEDKKLVFFTEKQLEGTIKLNGWQQENGHNAIVLEIE